jgi:putative endonuclease
MYAWFVYVVRCADGTLYTGIASDVERRIAEHLKANGKGAKYLRGRAPLELVFMQVCESRGAALSLESRMKGLSKAEKEEAIRCGEIQV